MIPPPTSVLYTQDPDLARRLNAYLRAIGQVRHVAEPNRLESVLRQTGPAMLIMDLRASECRDLIGQIQNEWPEVVIVALGTARSEPLREAGQLGIYAAEDLELARAVGSRCLEHVAGNGREPGSDDDHRESRPDPDVGDDHGRRDQRGAEP